MNEFEVKIRRDCGEILRTDDLNILQVNVGFLCNLSCFHCHLGCGPGRREIMSRETMDHVIRVAGEIGPELVDITGGAPELNPDYTYLVEGLRARNLSVQSRTNLTALVTLDMEDMISFWKRQKIRLVASFPCYLEEDVCHQRGEGTFATSIAVLQALNRNGYGRESDLYLDLVYNPGGPFLPPQQSQLEKDYKRELRKRFGIVFSNLLTITNMPVGRFLEKLRQEDKAEDYMQMLLNGFNCQTIEGLMCRHQINVGWDGTLFDCDFNLALDRPVYPVLPQNIRQFNRDKLERRRVVTGRHCFGCTAGFGSSCGGALAGNPS